MPPKETKSKPKETAKPAVKATELPVEPAAEPSGGINPIVWAGAGLVALAAALWIFSAVNGGARVAGIKASDPTAAAKIQQKLDSYLQNPILFTSGGTTYQLSAASLGVHYDVPAALAAAKTHHGLFVSLFGYKQALSVSYDDTVWAETLSQWSTTVSQKSSDAAIGRSGSGFTVTPAQSGTRLSIGSTTAALTSTLSNLSTTPTPIATYAQPPLVTTAELQQLWPKLRRWLSGPVTLTDAATGRSEEVTPEQIAKLIAIRPAQQATEVLAASPNIQDLGIHLLITDNRFFANFSSPAAADLSPIALSAITKTLAAKYDVDPQNAQLAWQNNALAVTAPSVDGTKLNQDLFSARLQSALDSNDRTVQLPLETLKPEIDENNLADLGITQLIGRGTSNYGISPPNRIHNILTGIARFKSVLVKPGVVFSFNDVLGPVDATTGYLPELSILQDKTVPEFGGGLCQVSSTAWRASLNAGLPTVSRTNHAYPVSYYFPIGTDATIYLPYPDMEWKNTTGHYILIQAYTQGSNVFFDYYGTNPPGQTVQFSRNQNMSPAVSDVVQLPNYVFNVQPDGTEDTIFYRTVTANGQTLLSDHFFTRYQPASKFPHVAQ